jgi:hypothetical protein
MSLLIRPTSIAFRSCVDFGWVNSSLELRQFGQHLVGTFCSNRTGGSPRQPVPQHQSLDDLNAVDDMSDVSQVALRATPYDDQRLNIEGLQAD